MTRRTRVTTSYPLQNSGRIIRKSPTLIPSFHSATVETTLPSIDYPLLTTFELNARPFTMPGAAAKCSVTSNMLGWCERERRLIGPGWPTGHNLPLRVECYFP